MNAEHWFLKSARAALLAAAFGYVASWGQEERARANWGAVAWAIVEMLDSLRMLDAELYRLKEEAAGQEKTVTGLGGGKGG